MESLSGLIEITIKQEHLDAVSAVENEYKRLNQEGLYEYNTHKGWFGLKWTTSTLKNTKCPFLFTFEWDGDDAEVYYKNGFCELSDAISKCLDKTIYLSLDNYNTLCKVMKWHQENWEE